MLGQDQYAYRVLWETAHGRLPRGTVLHHRCEHVWCVNLDHLQPMTRAAHMVLHGLPGDWGQAAKLLCRHGHPYAGANLYVSPNGGRHCRICLRAARRRWRAGLTKPGK